MAWVLYRLLPFGRFMEVWTPKRGGVARAAPEDTVRAVDRVLASIGQRRCFTRSLIIYRLLREEGHPLVFVIGFRRDRGTTPIAGRLLSHAWLESGGEVRWPFGDAAECYTTGFRYPPGGGPGDSRGSPSMGGRETEGSDLPRTDR